jgi:hypothetical protein
MTIALVVWVCLAPVMRVLEDADFFTSELDVLFISPLIHLHLAAWLVGIAVLSQWLAGKWDGQTTEKMEAKVRISLIPILMIALMFHWGLLYQPSYIVHEDMGQGWVIAGLVAAFVTLIWSFFKTQHWPAITRGLISFGSAAVVLGLSHWAQFLATPWAQESARVLETTPIWPLFVVLGLPALVCVAMKQVFFLKVSDWMFGIKQVISHNTTQFNCSPAKACSPHRWCWPWSSVNFVMALQPWWGSTPSDMVRNIQSAMR